MVAHITCPDSWLQRFCGSYVQSVSQSGPVQVLWSMAQLPDTITQLLGCIVYCGSTKATEIEVCGNRLRLVKNEGPVVCSRDPNYRPGPSNVVPFWTLQYTSKGDNHNKPHKRNTSEGPGNLPTTLLELDAQITQYIHLVSSCSPLLSPMIAHYWTTC